MVAVSGVTAGKMNGIALGGGGGTDWGSTAVDLPTTEATADSNTFVVEMTGSSAANETGVGGGLSGADLVWTQSGSIPAASGGFRALDGSMYFSCTDTFLTTLLGQSTWTIMTQIKNLTSIGNRWWRNIYSASYELYPYFLKTGGTNTCFIASPPNSIDGWHVVSVSGTKSFSGFKSGSTAPTRIDDLDYGILYNPSCGSNSWAGATTFDNRWIVGYNSGGTVFDVGTCVVSKLALGFPS